MRDLILRHQRESFFLKYILSLNTIYLPSLYLNPTMQPTSQQQQAPFKLIQLDYQWLTHFFDTLLLLFEPMLSNPFCLKIISGSSHSSFSIIFLFIR